MMINSIIQTSLIILCLHFISFITACHHLTPVQLFVSCPKRTKQICSTNSRSRRRPPPPPPRSPWSLLSSRCSRRCSRQVEEYQKFDQAALEVEAFGSNETGPSLLGPPSAEVTVTYSDEPACGRFFCSWCDTAPRRACRVL